jgi:hypothetical protein
VAAGLVREPAEAEARAPLAGVRAWARAEAPLSGRQSVLSVICYPHS